MNKITTSKTKIKEVKTDLAKDSVINNEEAMESVEAKEAKVAGEIETDVVFNPEKKEGSKRYIEAIGRRKRAIARVRIFTANPKDSVAQGAVVINNKTLNEYFSLPKYRGTALEALDKLRAADHFKVSVKVSGGGVNAQAESIRLGIARALVKFDINFRKKLKKSGLLSRDPREKERRKYGLKKARRAPQFSKR